MPRPASRSAAVILTFAPLFLQRSWRHAEVLLTGAIWDWDCPGLVDTLTLSSEVFPMPKSRPPYSPEFCRQMIELVSAGRSPEDLAREFKPTAQSIGNWVAKADKQEGRREDEAPGLTAAERDELARLRREVRQLRVERDILSKAAAWFARAQAAAQLEGAVPSGFSGS